MFCNNPHKQSGLINDSFWYIRMPVLYLTIEYTYKRLLFLTEGRMPALHMVLTGGYVIMNVIIPNV
jgi:hypothetical protein